MTFKTCIRIVQVTLPRGAFDDTKVRMHPLHSLIAIY